MNITKKTKERLFPFILTAAVIAADQISKAVIVATIEKHTLGARIFGDFLRIIHTRNLGVAFSLGAGVSAGLRSVLFTIAPLVVLAALLVYYFRSDEFTKLQRWAIAGILGGGLGNLIDRIFRAEGVVDFIDFKFYGLFGMERWPTFNIADSSVVVCGIILFVSIIFAGKKEEAENDG